MNDTAQIDASTAAVPSQGNDSAPAAPMNSGNGTPPSLPSANATESGTENSGTTPPAATPPATDTDAPPASLTTPKSVASTAPNSQAQPPKQLDDAAMEERREAGRWGRERERMAGELERLRKQSTELQQFREETMRKAQAQNLKRWDHQHPELKKFDGLLERREEARRQLARARTAKMPDGLSPEHAAAWRQSQEDLITSNFSDAERGELAEFDQHQQESLRGLTTNMPATIGKIVTPMIRQELQSFMREMKVQREVQRDQQDPELKPLFDRFGDDMARAMSEGVPYDQAVHYTKVYGAYESALAENARLKQQMDQMSGKVSAATVQQDLAKGKASITRDVNAPKPTPFKVALKWAQENGVDTDSDAFRRKIRELSN